jgi:hypothetical protein
MLTVVIAFIKQKKRTVTLIHGCHCSTSPLCMHKDKRLNRIYGMYACVFENWSYIARDDIVCPNKLSIDTCKAKVPHRTRSLPDWHSLHSLGHSFFLSSLPLSMVNFEKCNEMKIVERKKENVLVAIITAVYMYEQVKR